MTDDQGLNELADYIDALKRGLKSTHVASERPIYSAHLAAAAEIFAALYRKDFDLARTLLEDENRHHGWSFLSEDVGSEATAKFQPLIQRFRKP